MADVYSLNALKSLIELKIENALINEVSNAVKEKYQESITENVYQTYFPVRYDRRYVLGDVSYMESTYEGDGVLSTTTKAPSSPSVVDRSVSDNLAHWIEYGEVYPLWGGGEWSKARPFLNHTIDKIEVDNAHVEALKAGLIRQGLNVE